MPDNDVLAHASNAVYGHLPRGRAEVKEVQSLKDELSAVSPSVEVVRMVYLFGSRLENNLRPTATSMSLAVHRARHERCRYWRALDGVGSRHHALVGHGWID